MQDILQQKLVNWTPEQSDSFFNNVVRYSVDGHRVWEIAPTGYFIYSADYAGYFDQNGKTYELIIADQTENTTIKQAISDKADDLGLVKLEKPTTIELVNLFGLTYTYIEQVRPFNTMGYGSINLLNVPTNDLAESYTEFLCNSVNVIENLTAVIDAMNIDNSRSIYPVQLNNNVFYDPVSTSYFLAGNIDFSSSRDDFIAYVKSLFSHVDQLVETQSGQAISLQTAITNHINKTCTIIQLP
jgi:hypothetical protein